MKAIGFHGAPSEAIEEYLGTLDGLILGDVEGLRSMADADTHLDIWLGCAAMGALLNAPRYVSHAVSEAQYHRYKHKVDSADKLAAYRMKPEVWNPWKERIDGARNEELKDICMEIIADENLTNEQKQAGLRYVRQLSELRGWNQGRLIVSRDKRMQADENGEQGADATVEQDGTEGSYTIGYNAEDAADMQANNENLQGLQARLSELVGEDMMRQFDEDPMGALASIRGNEQWTDEERQLAVDYINAKAAYDGMIDRVRDDIDTEVAIANDEIDNNTSREEQGGDGMVHPALTSDGRNVFVVSGNVVMTDDGSIVDRDKSDNDIIIRDPATGKVEFVSVNEIERVDAAQDPNQLKEARANEISESMARKAADKIDGTVSVGGTYEVSTVDGTHNIQVLADDGNGTLSVSVDGSEARPMAKEQLEDMVYPKQQQAPAAAPQQASVENATEAPTETQQAEQTESAPVEGEAADDAMPMFKNGEPDFAATTAERGHRYLYDEAGIPKEVADNIVKANVDAATKEADKQAKALEKLNANPGTSVAKYKEQRAAIEAKQKEAESKKKYWEEVANRQSAIESEVAAAEEAGRTASDDAVVGEVEQEINDGRGSDGSLAGREQGDLAQAEEIDENGYPFVKANDGTTSFGEIREESGLQPAPIRLSEGFQDEDGKGYGLVHIEANHGEQIRDAGFSSVEEFVSFVAQNYDEDNIRVGKRRDNGNTTYLIQVQDEHDNTLFIELSRDGSYWNVNSAGVFRKGYSNKKETVAKTEPQQPNNAVSDGSSLSANENSGITSAEPNGEPTVSEGKDNTSSPNFQEKSEKSFVNETGRGESEDEVTPEDSGEDTETRKKDPLRTRAKQWAKRLGVKANIIESIDDVKNASVRRALNEGRKIDGWFDVDTGEVFIYMPNITKAEQIDKTYLHEVVGHLGLRNLFKGKGKATFDKLCDDVYNMMTEAQRKRFQKYAGIANEKDETKRRRKIADEFMARMAESGEFNPSIIRRIKTAVKELLRSLGINMNLTDADIEAMLRQSRRKLEKEAEDRQEEDYEEKEWREKYEKKREAERLEEQKAMSAEFDRVSDTQGELSEPHKAVKKKPDMFADRETNRPMLNGVYHDPSGTAVVTDGKLLYYDKSLYDAKRKGKTVATHTIKGGVKKGEVIVGKYPKWKAVLDSWKGKAVPADFDKMLDFLTGVERVLRERWKSGGEEGTFADFSDYVKVMIRQPNGTLTMLNYGQLRKFAEGAVSLDAHELIPGKDASSPLYATSENGGVLLMPVVPTDKANDVYPTEFVYDMVAGNDTNGVEGIKNRGDVMFREDEEELEEVNEKFNEELSKFTIDNADSFTFRLGLPSEVLLAAGVENKPIVLYGSKVAAKVKKHGFDPQQLYDLPLAVAHPIAVFDNLSRKGNRSVLTELKTAQGNFLVTIDLGKGSDVDFDIVSSVFGKRGSSVVEWINKGYLKYVDKEKALNYLHLSAPIAEASNNTGLISATKIIKEFENPSISEENSKKISFREGEEPSLQWFGFR